MFANDYPQVGGHPIIQQWTT